VTISELAEDRVVDGVFAVARKQRLRTRTGSAYLALELVDPSGRIDARVWSDVELLDKRFGEGDAVRVLGRVERFRDRLQLEVRTLEPATDDPASLVPEARRDVDEAEGFFEFLAAEIVHEGLRSLVEAFASDADIRARFRLLPATPDTHHSYSGGLLEHTVAVATICREAAQLHPRLRSDLVLAAALLHDVGRTRELDRGPLFLPTQEGKLLGHVHLGLRLVEERAPPRDRGSPRRPVRPHRRSGRPLPREPARRPGRHPAGGLSRERSREAVDALRNEPVVRPRPPPGNVDQPRLAQDAQVMGDRRLREAQILERADTDLTRAGETIDDCNSRRIAERLETQSQVRPRRLRKRPRPGRAARRGDGCDLFH
jgi:3'-5' exoribonuclease